MTTTTIVIPCYNEADRLEVDAFARFVMDHEDIAFLFVDDGSTDGTAEVIDRLVEKCPERLARHSLQRNCGKAEAVRQGTAEAFNRQSDFVGFWDADLATPLEDIVLFRDVFETRPKLLAVFGSRVNLLGRDVHRNLMRHYIGRVFATAAAAVLSVPIYDTQCGAKLFRRTPEVEAVFATPFLSRWIFDVEIIARLMLKLNGDEESPEARDVIFEQPLMIWRDVAGSKIHAKDFAVVGVDLARILLRYRIRKGAAK